MLNHDAVAAVKLWRQSSSLPVYPLHIVYLMEFNYDISYENI